MYSILSSIRGLLFLPKKHEKIMSATIGTTVLGMLGGMTTIIVIVIYKKLIC